MKARIEELAAKTTSQISGLLGDDTESIVRAALLTLAEECYEGAAKVCDETPAHITIIGPDATKIVCMSCAEEIRSLKDGLR